MSQLNNFIFDKNVLTLYTICKDQSLEELEKENFNVTSQLSNFQKHQYQFWLSLSKSQKEYISEQLENNDCVVANIKLYPVQRLDYGI